MVKVVRELALIVQTSNFTSYLFALQLAIDVWGGFFISVSVHKHLKYIIIIFQVLVNSKVRMHSKMLEVADRSLNISILDVNK